MGDENRAPGRQRGFRTAVDSLKEAGVEFSLRKALVDEELPMEGELDIWLDPRAVPATDAALALVGFHRFPAPGQGRHRFYLAFQEGRWLKLDAKLGERGRPGPDRDGLRGSVERIRAALARRRFAGLRRLGPVIAVLGPDGAGKGSVVAGLQRTIPVAVTTLYLGRLGARMKLERQTALQTGPTADGPAGSESTSKGSTERRVPADEAEIGRHRAGPIRQTAFVLRNALRSWTRLMPGYLAAWRGHIVLCDRHPIEVLAIKPDRTQPARAIERFIASHLTPTPDALILLDAPGEILLERKREHSAELLERWRLSYAEVFGPLGATIVPTTGSQKTAVAMASEAVWRALVQRRAW